VKKIFKKKSQNKKRAGIPSKSDQDSSNTKGINTRKKRAVISSDVNSSFNSSGSFSSGSGFGFGAKIEGNFGEQTGNKRGSRGSTSKAANIKEEDQSDEDDQQYYSFSGNFWKGISEYIVPFTKADLDFCSIEKIPNLDQKLFQIPSLGTHYKEIWHQEDQNDLQEIQQQGQEMYSGSAIQTRQVTSKNNVSRISEEVSSTNISDDMMSEKKDVNKPIRCGDITSRILSALIEDQLVPAHLLSNSYSGNSFQNSNRTTSENNISLTSNTGVPNQQHTMQEIDDRLKKEVLSLGLIDQGAINKIHLQKRRR